MIEIKYAIEYGHVELKQFNKFENGRMVTYGYSIKYDRDGREKSRTEPSALGSIGYCDNSDFTEKDHNKLMA